MDRQMGASEAPEVIPRCQTHTRIAQFRKGQFSPCGFTFPKGRLWCEIGTVNLRSPLAILEKKEFHTAVLLRYGTSILLSLAVANLPPCISAH